MFESICVCACKSGNALVLLGLAVAINNINIILFMNVTFYFVTQKHFCHVIHQKCSCSNAEARPHVVFDKVLK